MGPPAPTRRITIFSNQLDRFFSQAAVSRSLSCDWSSTEGGVVSRTETYAMANLDLEMDAAKRFDHSTVSPAAGAQATMQRRVDAPTTPFVPSIDPEKPIRFNSPGPVPALFRPKIQ
mmetsp:Transcript_18772/g.38880  ORF Transcript_18772/g.38880 Transcript_18772/m.38880 type:complete len:117 (+) Transcript_18772:1429-1779(+)